MTSTRKELKQKENQERLANAAASLDSITRNSNIQRNIRNMVKEVYITLKDEKSGSISVRVCERHQHAGYNNAKSTDAISYKDNALAGSFEPREHKGIEQKIYGTSVFFTGFKGGGSFSSL